MKKRSLIPQTKVKNPEPKEILENETRIGVIPATVKQFISAGCRITSITIVLTQHTYPEARLELSLSHLMSR